MSNANVVPIHKKRSKNDSTNYRPIRLMYILSKLIEHTVNSNILHHTHEKDIVYDLQHGFHDCRSCETQVIKIVGDVVEKMQSEKDTTYVLWIPLRHSTMLITNVF